MINFKAALELAEKQIYLKAYRYYKGNQSAAARALGVARGTFITKMNGWGAL